MPRFARVTLSLVALLACNQGLEPIPICGAGFVGVCGTVRFRGAVPDSTQAVYVIAYETFPDSRDDLFDLQPPIFLLQSLPLDDTVTTYTLPLTGPRYEWVLAAWVKQGFSLANADTHLYEAGYYRDPRDPSSPGVVLIPAGGSVDSVDFVIDFENMHPVSFWFPANTHRPAWRRQPGMRR
jgi:hypothetical protein